jgi:hypothetical protein
MDEYKEISLANLADAFAISSNTAILGGEFGKLELERKRHASFE